MDQLGLLHGASEVRTQHLFKMAPLARRRRGEKLLCRDGSWPAVSDFGDFMAGDAGAQARYQARKRRRVRITMDDIEPQSKKMSEADRDKFQETVAHQLTSIRRQRIHLHRYLAEFDFRYNRRTALGWNDTDRAAAAVKGAEGKRLMYAQPR